MKFIIFLICIFSSVAYSATCTTTTRNNYSSGQVLTSSALNADFNQIVSKVNSLDGGCVTDGTLEAASLKPSDFETVTYGIHEGCSLSYVDSNTIGVGKCILSVGGNFVKTTSQNNVTWGCTDCSAEVVSTTYYIYAKTTSTGSTLNLLISTTAPSADGYDATNGKVLGKFFNSSTSSINKYSIEQWMTSKFSQGGSSVLSAKDGVNLTFFSFSVIGVGTNQVCDADPCTVSDPYKFSQVSSAARNATGSYSFVTSDSFTNLQCFGVALSASASQYFSVISTVASDNVTNIYSTTDTTATARDTRTTFYCFGLKL